ncbi:MAG TPA: hypothetical protein VF820_02095 [Patescibacteria group bacterium]
MAAPTEAPPVVQADQSRAAQPNAQRAQEGTNPAIARQIEAGQQTENPTVEQQQMQHAVARATAAQKEFAAQAAERAQQTGASMLGEMASQQFPPQMQEIHFIEQQLSQDVPAAVRAEAIANAVITGEGQAKSLLSEFGIATDDFDSLVTRAMDEYRATPGLPPVADDAALKIAAERVVFAQKMTENNKWSETIPAPTTATTTETEADQGEQTESGQLAEDAAALSEEEPQDFAKEAQEIEQQATAILASGDDEAVHQAIVTQVGEDAYKAYQDALNIRLQGKTEANEIAAIKKEELVRVIDAKKTQDRINQGSEARAAKKTDEILALTNEDDVKTKVNEALDSAHAYDEFADNVKKLNDQWTADLSKAPEAVRAMTPEQRLQEARKQVLKAMIQDKIEADQKVASEQAIDTALEKMVYMEMEAAHQNMTIVDIRSQMGFDAVLREEYAKRFKLLKDSFKGKSAAEIQEELQRRFEERAQRMGLVEEAKERRNNETMKLVIKEEPRLLASILFRATTIVRMKAVAELVKLDPKAAEDTPEFQAYKAAQESYTKNKQEVADLDSKMKTMDKKSDEYRAAQSRRSALRGQMEIWEEAEKLREHPRLRKQFEETLSKKQAEYNGKVEQLIKKLGDKHIQLPQEFIDMLQNLPSSRKAMERSSLLPANTIRELMMAYGKKKKKDLTDIIWIIIMSVFGESLGEVDTLTSQR